MILNYRGLRPRVAGSAFIAPSADVIGDAEIEENSSVWFQAVLRGDVAPIRIGANSNVQDGCVLHGLDGVPTIIGEWVTVGHRAVLHGCTVEDHCLIGMGATVLSRARVGEGSIVAAGALVLEDAIIPSGTLYVGAPARFRRNLNESDRAFIDAHAKHYLEYRKNYLAGTA